MTCTFITYKLQEMGILTKTMTGLFLTLFQHKPISTAEYNRIILLNSPNSTKIRESSTQMSSSETTQSLTGDNSNND